MPLPAIPVAVWTILKVAGAAATLYEMYDLGKTVYGSIDNYQASLDEAKDKLKEMFESLKEEIKQNTDKAMEMRFLQTLEELDDGLQSAKTKKATGRGERSGSDIKAAIQQPIPFRGCITLICDQADNAPVFSLRQKRGVKVSDLPKAKKEAMARLLAVAADGLDKIADVDLDGFIAVRLKQLAASLIFECFDDFLGWKSPLKAEVCFGPRPNYDDPPKMAGSTTRLHRKGTAINPFYPMPIMKSGVIAADLAITDYRHDPLEKNNLFAIIEIKFQNDRIKKEQFDRYNELAIKCGKVKTDVTTLPRTTNKTGVKKGCRVALFRYPEDRAANIKMPNKNKSK